MWLDIVTLSARASTYHLRYGISTRSIPSNLDNRWPSQAGKTQSREATPTPDHAVPDRRSFVTPTKLLHFSPIMDRRSWALHNISRSGGDMDECASRDLAEVGRGLKAGWGPILQRIACASA